MKAPQERKTKKHLSHDHWEKVRLSGNDGGLSISFKRDRGYKGGRIGGPEGVRELRDFCQAWLDHHEQTQEQDQ